MRSRACSRCSFMTSQTVTTWASFWFRKLPMSPCPCGPTPMQPTTMRLPGATVPDLPSAEAGMREGKAAAERAKLVVCLRNWRRVELLLLILMWSVWSVLQNRSRHGSPCRARSMARMAEGRKCKIALPRTQRAFFFRRQARPCYNYDMKIPRMFITVGCLLGLLLSSSSFAAPPLKPLSQKIRVLLVTGGHPFEKEQFFKLFQDNPDVTYQAVEHPHAYALLKAEAAKQYDVIVTYDYGQKITEEAKADFVARLKEGKGLVVLHHAIAAYPAWPEYWNIIGAHYYLAATNVHGVLKPRSAWKEGMDFRLHIPDPAHPVTRGLSDFDIHDETYKWFDVAKDCHPLVTTDEPESNNVIAWAKTYKGTRVIYIQSGHGHAAYENPNYQQLLRQAIRWTARKG